jgi:hypothetical protein
MKLAPGLLLVPLAFVAFGCSSGEDNSAGMDGLIEGVPVSEYQATTTVPGPSTAPTTTSTTLAPPPTTVPPETTIPAESATADEAEDLVAWRSATVAVCAEYQPRIQALTEALAPPDTLDDAAVWFDRVNPTTARYLRALVAVPVPDSRREDVEALYVLAEDLKETARVAQAAAHFDDQASYDLAAAGLAASGDAADELLLALDVPECVAEADGGTA